MQLVNSVSVDAGVLSIRRRSARLTALKPPTRYLGCDLSSAAEQEDPLSIEVVSCCSTSLSN
ncbi:hypothetical protein M3J09_007036 [Ascochyta lentis]